MLLNDSVIEAIVEKYIKSGQIIAFGTSQDSEALIKKVALQLEDDNIDLNDVSVVPTSHRIAEIVSDLGMKTASINEREIDVAFEFVDKVDKEFNFIKQESSSFVRDKMIAQSAAELIVFTHEKHFLDRLQGTVPFEICTYGWKRTMTQLGEMGHASLREVNGKPFKTETGHFVIDVIFDEIFSVEDLEFEAKDVPGVLETGLFIGYADRVILASGKALEVKSRMDYSKQNETQAEKALKRIKMRPLQM